VHTTLSVDDDILKKAKDLNCNISGEFNAFLRNRFVPTVNDLPDENVKVFCSECGKEITEGYKCEELRKLYCEECEKSVNMHKHPHDPYGEHQHIKW